MGQSYPYSNNKSNTLKKALSISQSKGISLEQIKDIIQGGTVCTDHGVKLLADSPRRPDLVPVLDALLVTSERLLGEVDEYLSRQPPEEDPAFLFHELERTRQANMFIWHWLERLRSEKPHQNSFDA